MILSVSSDSEYRGVSTALGCEGVGSISTVTGQGSLGNVSVPKVSGASRAQRSQSASRVCEISGGIAANGRRSA